MVSSAVRGFVFSVFGSGLSVLAQVPAAPGGAAVRPAVTAEQQVRQLVRGLQAGEAAALWAFMPPSWQQDVDGLVREFGTKVDPALYEQGMGVVARLGEVMQTKREFVLGSQLVAGGAADKLAPVVDAFGAVMRSLAESDLATHRGLRKFDGRKFCATAGSTMLAELLECGGGKGQKELQALRVRGVRQEKTTATVSIAGTGKSAETEEYRLVEGRWVPVKLADQWAPTMTRAKAAVRALPDGGDKKQMLQARTMLSMVEGVLKNVEDAETQQEFDEAIAPLLQMAKGGAARRAQK